MREDLSFRGTFVMACVDKDGALKWEGRAENTVVNTGLNHVLGLLFTGSVETQIDPWYVGLVATSPTVAAADTASAHAGWTEFLSYTGNRQTFVDARSAQSVSNSASAATFAITTAGTVGGAFLVSANTGSGGTLLCAAALTGSNRTVADTDTVNVTYTFTTASV